MIHSKDLSSQARPAALERRKHRRHPTRLGGNLRIGLADQSLRDCDVLDVSANGALIRTSTPLTTDSWVTLGIAHFGKVHAQVVWCKDNLAGIQFAADPRYVARMIRRLLPARKAAA